MKIVSRKDFLAMPEETLYAKYQPCYFEALEIKGETLSNDFLTQQIVDAIACKDSGEFSDLLHESETTGKSVKFDFDCQGRDGCFDDDQLFAVWERDDVLALIERLTRLIAAPQNDTYTFDRLQSSVAGVEVDLTRPLDEQCIDGEGKQ